jgi:predicted DNA-binding protein
VTDVFLSVRIPKELAARLADHKQRTLVPMSAFERQAIERALAIEPKELQPK